MSDGEHTPANSTDFPPVAIYFQDQEISHLFAELLRTRGVEAQSVRDLAQCCQETRIITEAQFFPAISPDKIHSCLVVGNREAVEGLNAQTLVQPLTGPKIENALKRFLG